MLLATLGAIAFSGKAIIVKLAYRYGVDAVTLIMYRMLFALPIFALMAWWASRGKAALTRKDWLGVLWLGFTIRPWSCCSACCCTAAASAGRKS